MNCREQDHEHEAARAVRVSWGSFRMRPILVLAAVMVLVRVGSAQEAPALGTRIAAAARQQIGVTKPFKIPGDRPLPDERFQVQRAGRRIADKNPRLGKLSIK